MRDCPLKKTYIGEVDLMITHLTMATFLVTDLRCHLMVTQITHTVTNLMNLD